MFNVEFSIKDIREKERIEGRKEGLQEGLQEGRQEKAIEVAGKLLQKGCSIADISDSTGLEEAVILNLRRVDVSH